MKSVNHPSQRYLYTLSTNGNRQISHEKAIEFINAAVHSSAKNSLLVQLFADVDSDECLALTYDNIDCSNNTINITNVLNHTVNTAGSHLLPNPRARKYYVMPLVIDALQAEIQKQSIFKREAGISWHNEDNMIFTTEFGSSHLIYPLRKENKIILTKCDLGNERCFAVCTAIRQEIFNYFSLPDRPETYPFGTTYVPNNNCLESINDSILHEYFSDDSLRIIDREVNYHEY